MDFLLPFIKNAGTTEKITQELVSPFGVESIMKNSIVVDLDGTLSRTDTLYECIVLAITKNPFVIFYMPLWLRYGVPQFKKRLVQCVPIDELVFIFNQDLLRYLNQEKKLGRQVILATGADRTIADKVAADLGIFDKVISSDGNVNCTGVEKLDAVRRSIGDHFIYVGNSKKDIPIWAECKRAVLVGNSKELSSRLETDVSIELEFPEQKKSFWPYIGILRPHQWVKNLLVFVPAFVGSSDLNLESILMLSIGFFAFSMVSSAGYIINDIVDLQSDRRNPEKKFRPLASGDITLPNAIILLLFLFGLLPLVVIPLEGLFSACVILYLVTTIIYSFRIKTIQILDLIFLAALYVLRVIAGGVVAGIKPSANLLSFAMMIFFSLATLKRCVEISNKTIRTESSGLSKNRRPYVESDTIFLVPLGLSTACSALVIFTIFIGDLQTQAQYNSPWLLWLACVVLSYWIFTLWLDALRGKVTEDPIQYAMKNKKSLVAIFVILLLMLVARFK